MASATTSTKKNRRGATPTNRQRSAQRQRRQQAQQQQQQQQQQPQTSGDFVAPGSPPMTGSNQSHQPAPYSPAPAATVDLDDSTPDETSAIAYDEALDDVHTRFILNLPPEELATSDRIFFQLEQAYWFYDDFHCDDAAPGVSLPRFKHLRPFAIKMFRISPLLNPMMDDFDDMWNEFSSYKRSISTYGTILLNDDCTKLVLCQDWSGKAWTFPAGKVNQNEAGIEAGARETYEETGFDPSCVRGSTKVLALEAQAQGESLPWSPLDRSDALVYTEDNGSGKRRTCYVCRGVPEDFPFEPVARKEVSVVKWHDIENLPKKSYAVLPLMSQLRRWIRKNNKRRKDRQNDEGGDDDKHKSKDERSSSRKKGKNRSDSNKRERDRSRGKGGSRPHSRSSSRGKVLDPSDPLAACGLAKPGDDDGWTEDDMFRTNERLLGRPISYDGNPHEFAEKGFGVGGDGGRRVDPHAFRVVGGGFMNDPGGGAVGKGGSRGVIAPPPARSRLQPLFRRDSDDADDDASGTDHGGAGGDGELTPFFSEGGETPWGEVVAEALAEDGAAAARAAAAAAKAESSNGPGLALLNMIQGGVGDKDDEEGSSGLDPPALAEAPAMADGPPPTDAILIAGGSQTQFDELFMTDAEITARSQREKNAQAATAAPASTNSATMRNGDDDDDAASAAQLLREWVEGLPRPGPTRLFGDFRFDVDAIMSAMEVK